jgi:hypothetical protein
VCTGFGKGRTIGNTLGCAAGTSGVRILRKGRPLQLDTLELTSVLATRAHAVRLVPRAEFRLPDDGSRASRPRHGGWLGLVDGWSRCATGERAWMTSETTTEFGECCC